MQDNKPDIVWSAQVFPTFDMEGGQGKTKLFVLKYWFDLLMIHFHFVINFFMNSSIKTQVFNVYCIFKLYFIGFEYVIISIHTCTFKNLLRIICFHVINLSFSKIITVFYKLTICFLKISKTLIFLSTHLTNC